jgi:hypothetical protein
MAFFSKTNVMIKLLHNLHSLFLSQKLQFFWRKYLKNNNTGSRNVATVERNSIFDQSWSWGYVDIVFFPLKSYHPMPWRDSISRHIAPVSSVAGGDDTIVYTTPPRLYDTYIHMYCCLRQNWRFF